MMGIEEFIKSAKPMRGPVVDINIDDIVVDDRALNFFFVVSFVTDDLVEDIGDIAHTFLQMYPDGIDFEESEDILSLADPFFEEQKKIIAMRIIALIYNVAKSGDAPAAELLKYLFKTFHRSLYNQLKRFRKITAQDLISLSTDLNAPPISGKIAVGGNYLSLCIVMCPFFGIEVEEDGLWSGLCNSFFNFFDEYRDKFTYEEVDFNAEKLAACVHDAIDLVNQNGDEIADMMLLSEKVINATLRDEFMSGDVLNDLLRDEESVMPSLADAMSLVSGITDSDTSAILELTSSEMALMSRIVILSRAYSKAVQKSFFLIEQIMGVSDTKPEHFSAEKVPSVPVKASAKVSKPKSYVEDAKDKSDMERKLDVCSQEVVHLRSKLQESESTVRGLRSELATKKRENEELLAQIKNCADERTELIALRNYVHSLTEEFTEQKCSLEEMSQYVSEKNVVIVGGNQNWIKKLKNVCPKWQFISPNATVGLSDSVFIGADMVYFFTDSLSHRNYFRYINLMREKKLRFGYMHGVNLEMNISQVYQDLKVK